MEPPLSGSCRMNDADAASAAHTAPKPTASASIGPAQASCSALAPSGSSRRSLHGESDTPDAPPRKEKHRGDGSGNGEGGDRREAAPEAAAGGLERAPGGRHELAAAAAAVGGILRQRPAEHSIAPCGQSRAPRAWTRYLLVDVSPERGEQPLARVGRLSCQTASRILPGFASRWTRPRACAASSALAAAPGMVRARSGESSRSATRRSRRSLPRPGTSRCTGRLRPQPPHRWGSRSGARSKRRSTTRAGNALGTARCRRAPARSASGPPSAEPAIVCAIDDARAAAADQLVQTVTGKLGADARVDDDVHGSAPFCAAAP
jgi:hypothetical protein